MKNETVLNLANELNRIEKEINNLEIERMKVIQKLWDLIPSLKDDVNLQKRKVRKYEDSK